MKMIAVILKRIWLFALLFFASWYIIKHSEQIKYFIETIPPRTIIAAFLLLVMSKCLLASTMYLSLQSLGLRLGFFDCFRIYNATQIAKYLPGGFWHYVGKAGCYREKSFDASQIRDALLMETFWVLFGAGFSGVCFFFLSSSHIMIQACCKYNTYLWVAGVLLVILTSLFFEHCKRLINVLVRKIRITSVIFAIQFVLWFLMGCSFYLIAGVFLNFETPFLFICGVYALAYVIGFMTPLAPAGIGVREAILVGGMLNYMPVGNAIIVAGFHRMLYVITEIVLILLPPAFIFVVKYLKIIKGRNTVR